MPTNYISIGTFSLLDVSKNRSYGKPIEYDDETITIQYIRSVQVYHCDSTYLKARSR